MKKSLLPFIFFLLFVFNVKGQNLVPNGDFEQYSGCPDDYSQIDSALFWNGVIASPDYFNQCAPLGHVSVPLHSYGFQYAHSGGGYGGIYLFQGNAADFRECIEIPFINALSPNVCYRFEMYVNLYNLCSITTDMISVAFLDTSSIGAGGYIPFNPDINMLASSPFDSLNWTYVSGNYVANGSENYLVIGNHNEDSLTNIYSSTGTVNNVYVFIDDVSLTPCTSIEEQNQNDAIKIYPNPVKDELLVSGLKFLVGKNSTMKIYDVTGRETQPETKNLKPETRINVSTLKEGIYLLEINNGKNIFRKKFLKE